MKTSLTINPNFLCFSTYLDIVSYFKCILLFLCTRFIGYFSKGKHYELFKIERYTCNSIQLLHLKRPRGLEKLRTFFFKSLLRKKKDLRYFNPHVLISLLRCSLYFYYDFIDFKLTERLSYHKYTTFIKKIHLNLRNKQVFGGNIFSRGRLFLEKKMTETSNIMNFKSTFLSIMFYSLFYFFNILWVCDMFYRSRGTFTKLNFERTIDFS